MKIIISTEEENADIYAHSMGYYMVVSEINEHLRSRLKYGNLEGAVYDEVEKIRTYLFGLINDNHLPEV